MFLPITDNFSVFCIVFEWCRIFESAMDREKVKFYAKLCLNYFSVNVSVLDVVFHRQISKNLTISGKIVGFLESLSYEKKKKKKYKKKIKTRNSKL